MDCLTLLIPVKMNYNKVKVCRIISVFARYFHLTFVISSGTKHKYEINNCYYFIKIIIFLTKNS